MHFVRFLSSSSVRILICMWICISCFCHVEDLWSVMLLAAWFNPWSIWLSQFCNIPAYIILKIWCLNGFCVAWCCLKYECVNSSVFVAILCNVSCFSSCQAWLFTFVSGLLSTCVLMGSASAPDLVTSYRLTGHEGRLAPLK